MKLQKPKHHYAMKVFWSDEDKEYIAVAPELSGCSASSDTPEKALHELETAMDLWLEARQENGWSIPKPLSEREMQGRILLRLPKDLHRALMEDSVEQGVSLNQYLLYLLSGNTKSMKPRAV